MTETPSDRGAGYVAVEPEHGHDFYRFVPPGKTYHLTAENQALVTLLSLLQ